MKKNLLFQSLLSLIAILFLNQMLLAEPVDPNTAATVGKHFFQSTKKGQALAENVSLELVFSAPQANELTPALLYVFNVNTHGGYVIVAADDAVQPILGYSDEGAFELHPGIEKWMEGYKAQIFYAIENKVAAPAPIREKWTSLKTGVPNTQESGGVGPLLNTKWNQSPFENMFCPGGSVTGCVATAMAQLMYYWQYPVQGVGSHSYLEAGSATVPSYGTLFADFGSATYQWGNMPLHPSSPSPEISLLMLHCGISVDMNYSPTSSGTTTDQVPNALKTYFKYDPTTVAYKKRSAFSESAWINLLKQELNAFRPMQYRGTGSAGGHSFVCDGYDDNDFFHFNWGWGGSSDGFFAVNGLNPPSIGTGGGAGGFNTDQAVVIGIQPDPTVKAELVMTTNLNCTPSILDGQPLLVFSTEFANTGSQNFDGDVTLGIYDQETGVLVNTSSSIHDFVSLGGGGVLFNDNFDLPALPPGAYTVSFIYRFSSSEQWAKIPNGQFNNSAPLTIFTVSTISLMEKPSGQAIAIQPNAPFSITAKLQNQSASEPVFSGSLAASLHGLDGAWLQDIVVKSSQTLIVGSPASITFSTSGINATPGTYQLVFWASGTNGWQKVNVNSGVDATTFLTILPPTPVADAYEPNGSEATAKVLSYSFAGNIALISTFGTNHHIGEDEDYYKVVLPSDPGFIYSIKGTLYDADYHPLGGNYTNDCFWRFNNGNTWSLPFDDVLQVSGMSFLMQAGAEALFFVKPTFAGTTGSYLLDLEITRLPAFDAPCGAINLPVNGVAQTGFSNVNATASGAYEPGFPAPGDCMGPGTWCNTETGTRVLHTVWFSFQAPPSGSVEISTCGLSDFDTQLALYLANGCGNLPSFVLIAANDDGANCAGFTSLITKSGLNAGETYYIMLDGYENETGNIGIQITPLQGSAVQNLAATPDVLAVSPNPTSGLLNIEFKGESLLNGLRLTDMGGKLVQSNSFQAGVRQTSLDLSALPNGVYWLQAQTADKVYTQKIVIQH